MKRKWWLVLDVAFLTLMAGLMVSLWPESGRTPQSEAPAMRLEPPVEMPVPPVIELPAVEALPMPPTAEPAATSRQARPLPTPYNVPGVPRLWRVK